VRQWAQSEIQETPLKHKENLFHCKGSQTLAQVSQGNCGVAMLGDTQLDVVLDPLLQTCLPTSVL